MQVETATDSSLSESAPEASVRDIFALLKPKVMTLVVFTGFAGFVVAPGAGDVHPFLIAIAMLALALGAGSAGAFNMWYDRDIDARMGRTRLRPIPSGRVDADDALAFSLLTQALAISLMGLALNWVAAGLLAFAGFFYAIVYTVILKRRTPQNIVIGGAAGAFPPMIGWAAATGDVSWDAVALFALIFLWTPPHFWALSLFAREDYARAGIPMLPVTHGVETTRRHMLAYTLILLPVSLAPVALGTVSFWPYGAFALALSGFFVFTAVQVMRLKTDRAARAMFGYSIFYLFALFLALLAG